MAKIPFNIKFRDKIESGEYRVETRDGMKARIVCWNRISAQHPIVALISCKNTNTEVALDFTEDGRFYPWTNTKDDLFIITPEEELTEFEDELRKVCEEAVKESMLFPYRTSENFAKTHSDKLISLARKELIKEQYTSDPRKTDLYKLGKAEVLEDLPRWEKYLFNAGDKPVINGIMQSDGSYEWRIYLDGYKIEISDLKKLPGFKED